jgi:hypothetical protein
MNVRDSSGEWLDIAAVRREKLENRRKERTASSSSAEAATKFEVEPAVEAEPSHQYEYGLNGSKDADGNSSDDSGGGGGGGGVDQGTCLR